MEMKTLMYELGCWISKMDKNLFFGDHKACPAHELLVEFGTPYIYMCVRSESFLGSVPVVRP